MSTELTEEWLEGIEDDWRSPPVDYGTLRVCQFPVSLGKWYPDWYGDCGEPATNWLWWNEHDSGIYVCEEHFHKVEETEKAGAND